MDVMLSAVLKIKRIHLMMLLMILVTWLGCSFGAPTTRPLEHSPSDLAWDAWVKHGHPHEAIPPRRITTKSLFVFPNVNADSLPACADGYRADSMGRCVKVVKVNESAHLEFVLQKLNSQFATDSSETDSDEVYDYDVDTDSSDGSGPFQVNIPLAIPITGHNMKNDENQQGEFVLINKKDPPQKSSSHSHHKTPTSSPEVVPDSVQTDSFFPGGPPAEPQGVLSSDSSSSTGGVSILIPHSPNVGLTLLASSHGKPENDDNKHHELASVNNESSGDKSNGVTETTIVDKNIEIITESEEMAPIPDALTVTEAQIHIEETTRKRNTLNSNVKQNDELIKQIESLKMKPEEFKKTTEHRPHNHHSDRTKPEEDDIDIEEKIKIISKFADVSRNTEGAKKRPSSDYVRFPSSSIDETVDYKYSKPLDLMPAPSEPIELPINAHGMPIPDNSVYNLHPVEDYEKFQPLHYDRDTSSDETNKYKTQWLPYGWDVHGNTNGEHNLIDLWSRLSMLQRYPYNVRLHQEEKPKQRPSLYPSSQESSESRLNVRHTVVNYRQGREDMLRRRRLYQDDSMNYDRGHHPQDQSHPMRIYSGR